MDPELYDALQTVSQVLAVKLPQVALQETKVDQESEPIPKEWAVNIERIIFPASAIELKVREMARVISADYAGKEIVVVGLLKGAFLFVADLVRRLSVPYVVDFMVLSSYDGEHTTGNVKVKKDMGVNPHGKHILIVEDLIDTGNTLKWMRNHLASKGAASLKIACLLNKTARRSVEVEVDYVGYQCPDEFVVGYGMDFNSHYRCLPFIGVLKPEAYSS